MTGSPGREKRNGGEHFALPTLRLYSQRSLLARQKGSDLESLEGNIPEALRPRFVLDLLDHLAEPDDAGVGGWERGEERPEVAQGGEKMGGAKQTFLHSKISRAERKGKRGRSPAGKRSLIKPELLDVVQAILAGLLMEPDAPFIALHFRAWSRAAIEHLIDEGEEQPLELPQIHVRKDFGFNQLVETGEIPEPVIGLEFFVQAIELGAAETVHSKVSWAGGKRFERATFAPSQHSNYTTAPLYCKTERGQKGVDFGKFLQDASGVLWGRCEKCNL